MASDNLNQVGRYIGRTKKTADRALNRDTPINPKVERIRDVFDPLSPFEINFETDQNERVLLDLFFNLPPPIRGCKVGCIHTKCEAFDFTNGNHAVTVANPYLSGTVSVYIDGDKLENSQVFETNPSGGEVFFQGPASYEAVSVCYIYLSDCTEPSNLCLFDFAPSFAGAELAFCDRFDRGPSAETFCGLGKWYSSFSSALTGEALPVSTTGGEATFSSFTYGQEYVFENVQGANVISETIWVADCRGWGPTSSTSYSLAAGDNGYGLTVTVSGSNHRILITRPYRYTPTDTPGSSWGFASITQTFAIPIPPNEMNQYMVFRFFVSPGLVQFKMWPLGQAEPSSWIQHTLPASSTPFVGVTASYTDVDFTGGAFGGTMGLLAVEHWIGRNQIFGRWSEHRQESLPGYSWYYSTPMPQENRDFMAAYPNVYFQADDNGFAPSLTQYQAGSINLPGPTVPTHIYSYVTGFFDAGEPAVIDFTQKNLFSGSGHYAVSFDTQIGKPTTYKIRGQARWKQDSASRGIIPHMTVELQAMDYGGQTPSTGGYAIYGEVKQTLFLPMDPASTVELPGASDSYSGWRAASAWTDFEIEVPCSGYHLQWGVKFLDDPLDIQEQLGLLAVDSILRSTNVHVEFRGLYFEALMNPITTSKNICDAGLLSSRCTQIIESFDVPYVANTECYDSLVIHSDQYLSSDAGWSMKYRRGVVLPNISNNKIRVDFKARGLTTDGSDGRCPRDFNQNGVAVSGGTSRTSESFSMFTTYKTTLNNFSGVLSDSPAICGWFDYYAKFKLNVTNSWLATNGITNFTLSPGYVLRFGTYTGTEFSGNLGTAVSPYVQLFTSSNNLIKFLSDGTANSILFPLSNNIHYQLYAQFRDQLYIKIWPVGSAEPSAWDLIVPLNVATLGQAIGFDITLSDYGTDGGYLEVSDIQAVSVERII